MARCKEIRAPSALSLAAVARWFPHSAAASQRHLSPPEGEERAPPAYRSSRRNGFSRAEGATALRDMKAMATMVKMKGSIRKAS